MVKQINNNTHCSDLLIKKATKKSTPKTKKKSTPKTTKKSTNTKTPTPTTTSKPKNNSKNNNNDNNNNSVTKSKKRNLINILRDDTQLKTKDLKNIKKRKRECEQEKVGEKKSKDLCQEKGNYIFYQVKNQYTNVSQSGIKLIIDKELQISPCINKTRGTSTSSNYFWKMIECIFEEIIDQTNTNFLTQSNKVHNLNKEDIRFITFIILDIISQPDVKLSFREVLSKRCQETKNNLLHLKFSANRIETIISALKLDPISLCSLLSRIFLEIASICSYSYFYY
jgi:hypothetical protein